jgi:hypothetical protein
MRRHPKTAKRAYTSPSLEELDLRAAKAKLEAKGDPKDLVTRKMLSLIDDQLMKGSPGYVLRSRAHHGEVDSSGWPHVR